MSIAAIAAIGNIIAVGTSGLVVGIRLINYKTGGLILSFGTAGSGTGQIGGYPTDLEFSPDGTLLQYSSETTVMAGSVCSKYQMATS